MPDSNPAHPAHKVRVDIVDDDALYAAYMPFIGNGGIFVHAHRLSSPDYALGDPVLLQLCLHGGDERLEITGQVIWKCTRPGNRRAPGIGVQFRDNGEMQNRLEQLLAGRQDAGTPTHTL